MKVDTPSCSQPRKGKGKGSGGFSNVSRGSGLSCGLRGKMKGFESQKEKKRRLILSDSDEEKISPRRKSGNASVDRKVKLGGSLEVKEESAINGKRTAGSGLDDKRRKMDSLRVTEDCEIDKRRTKAETLMQRVEDADYLDPYAYRDDDEFDRRLIMNSGRDVKKNCVGSYKCSDDGDIDSRKIKMNSLKRKERKTDVSDLTVDRFDEGTDTKGNSSSGTLKKRKLADSSGSRVIADVDMRNMKMESGKIKEEKPDGRGSWDLGSRLVSPTSRQREGEMESGSTSKGNKKGTRNGVSVFERKRKTDGSDKKRFRLEKDDDFELIGAAKGKYDAPHDTVTTSKGKNGVSKLFVKGKVKAGNREKREGKGVHEEYVNDPGSANICRRAAVHSSFSGEKKFYERRGSSAAMVKGHSRKVSSSDKNKVNDVKKEGSDRTVKMRLKNKDAFSVKTEDAIKQERRSPLQSSCAIEQNDRDQKIGRAEEKQLLREQIKDMLLNAGWKIDCRPRISRDYKDFVYIAPSGREYWSIINAYNEFQRQYLESSEGSGGQNLDKRKSLLPVIPVEALSILKRKPGNEAKKLKKNKNNKKNKLKCDKLSKKSKVESKKKLVKNRYIKETVGCRMKQDGNVKNKPGARDREILLKKEHNLAGSMLKEELESSEANLVQGTNQIRQRGFHLLARNSSEGGNLDAGDLAAFAGKRTVLSWLIDSQIVPENGKVQYMNKRRTRAMMKGSITGDGINCSCCSKILTVPNFEIHAGSKLCRPLQNIFVESGISLLQCQLDAWNKQEESERTGFHFIDPSGDDPNDDTCGICGDGGDLICCDGCPSTFHLRCLHIEMLPPGDWHCPNCSCKFCGSVCSSLQGESSSLLSCSQCVEKYHQECIQETEVPAGPDGISMPFCGRSCEKLFAHLRELLGLRNELEAGFSWTLLQRFDEVSDTSTHGLEQKVECNSKLAVALAVMDECFFPIIDRRTGFNLIRHVLYNVGSNFNRLNYSGFYTFILERGDEIISVASIRIHGTRLAEMPFIGTRHMYRRQGMCRRLLNAIESALCSLNVEKLIIPAISELMHTWTTVFNFMPLEESHRREMRSMNLVVFPGTDMLQKPLLKTVSIKGKTNSSAGASEIESDNSDAPNASHVASSVGPVVNSCDEGENGVTSAEPELHAYYDSSAVPSVTPIGPSLEAYGITCSDSKPQGKSSEAMESVDFVAHLAVAHQHKPDEENPAVVVFSGEKAFESESNNHDTPEAANPSSLGSVTSCAGAKALEVESNNHDASEAANSSVGSVIHSCNGVEDGVAAAVLDLRAYHNSPAGPCDDSVAYNLQANGTVCSDAKPQDKSLEVSDGAFILHGDAVHQGNPDEEIPSPVVFPVTDILQEPLKKHVSTEGKTDVSVGPVIHSGDEVEVAEPDQHACSDSPFGSSDACVGSHLQADGTECSDSVSQDQSSDNAGAAFLIYQCAAHQGYPDAENLSPSISSDEPTIPASGDCAANDTYQGKVDATELKYLGEESRHNSGGTFHQSPNAAFQAFGERNLYHCPNTNIPSPNTASLDKFGAFGESILQHDSELTGRASECASTSVVSLPHGGDYPDRDHHDTLEVACKTCISSSAEPDMSSSSGNAVCVLVKVREFVTGENNSQDLDGNCMHLTCEEDGESLKAASGLNSGSFVKDRSSELLGNCESSSDISHGTHSDVIYHNALEMVKETPLVAAAECDHHNEGAVPYAGKIGAEDKSTELLCNLGSSNISLFSDSNTVYCYTVEVVKGSLVLLADECRQQEGTLLCSDKMSIDGASLKLDSQVCSEESACCFTTDFTVDSLECSVSEPN